MKSKRKQSLLFYVDESEETETFEIIGKDNDELSRSLNNEVEDRKSVV